MKRHAEQLSQDSDYSSKRRDTKQSRPAPSIASFINKLNNLSSKKQNSHNWNEKVIQLFDDLSQHHQRWRNEFYNWITASIDVSKRTQTIGYLLYNLGGLAKKNKHIQPVSSQWVDFLLSALASFPESRTSKAFSLSMHGMGQLALACKLQGNIEHLLIEDIMAVLCQLAPLNTQALANSLNALGYLAKNNRLQGTINSQIYQSWLQKLLELPDIDSQALSNSLTALGYLANNHRLVGSIDSQTYQIWLEKLLKLPNLKSQELSMSLTTLGYLANNNYLVGTINCQIYQDWLQKLLKLPNLKSQELSMSLTALGYLAKNNHLVGTINCQTYQDWLQKLLELPAPESQHLSTSLMALGYLAKNNHLVGTIHCQIYQDWLQKLLKLPNLKSQELSMSLTALGYLAKNSRLVGTIHCQIYQDWLQKLLKLADIDSQELATSLMALGQLAKANQLTGQLSITTIHSLLNSLLAQTTINSLDVTQSCVALALLQPRYLTDSVSMELLTSLLERQVQFTVLQRIQVLTSLPTLFALQPSQGFPYFQQFFEQSLTYFLHPSHAVNLLPAFLHYKQQLTQEQALIELELLFTSLLMTLTAINYFSPSVQDTLREQITQLKTISPVWAEQLEQQLKLTRPSTPTPEPGELTFNDAPSLDNEASTEEEEAFEEPHFVIRYSRQTRAFVQQPENGQTFPANPLLQALEDNNEITLKTLLGLSQNAVWRTALPTTNHREASRRESQATETSRHANPQRQLSTVQVQIDQLFNTTEAARLEHLFANSTAGMLRWLFKAYGMHQLNQLARTTTLHPLWLQLPLRELRLLVDLLISPFSLYRDKGALLNVIDALTLRMSRCRSNAARQALQSMQIQLLDRGITFHERCNHTLVLPLLVNALNAVNQQQITLLTHEELEEIEEQSLAENPSSLDERLLENPAERTFEQQQPVAENAASATLSRPYLNYCYDASDIRDLLSCRLQSLPAHQQVVCLEVVSFQKYNELLQTQQPNLINVIHKWLASATPSQQQVTTVIPIATKHNQWIALLITWQHRTIQRLFFFDSANDKNNTIYYTHHLTDILARTKLLSNVPICNAQTEWKPLLTQTKTAASGAYLIENIYCACKQQFWDPNTSEKTLRERHLQLLPAEQRQAFINKQTRAWQQDQNNRSSISTANNYPPRLFQPLGRAQPNLQNPSAGITPK